MLVTKESQDRAYDQAAQAYWDELYAAVQKNAGAYNIEQPALAHIVVEWAVGENERFVGEKNALHFTVWHIQKRNSATEINRDTEKRPHAVDVICHGVIADGPRRLILKKTAAGNIEAHHDNGEQMTLADFVELIVNPLKRLGCVPNHEADEQQEELLPDDES